MTNRCEQCGKPVLKNDSTCWHCGFPVSKTASAETPQPLSPDELPEPTTSIKLLVYGGLTAAMVLALLGVMFMLSRQPIVALTPGIGGSGWQVVDSPAHTFTLTLPNSWEISQIESEDGRSQFESLSAEDNLIATAAIPFGQITPDAELRLLARNETSEPATLIVVQSDNLSRLSPGDMLTSLRSGELGEFEVLNATTADGIDGRQQAQFALRHPDNLRCEQRIIPLDTTAFIVSACAPFDRYPLYSVGFETLLDTFQTLER